MPKRKIGHAPYRPELLILTKIKNDRAIHGLTLVLDVVKGNILRMLDTWFASVKFKTHELESLAGVLSFVTRVIRPAQVAFTT